MVGPLALAVVMMASLQQGPAGGMIRGEVRSHGSRTPLRYATVELLSQPALSPVSTDSTGAYQLRNIPSGWHLMRVTHIDHATFQEEVLIAEGKEVLLDFDLDLRPVKLPPVTAQIGISFLIARDTLPAGSAGLAPATARVLESSPGVTELGLAEMVRDVPGEKPPDPSDVLYVRGGAADMKLVLLDGAPVYAPFHLGGLINPLDPDVLRSATLYIGGAPARYDGGLSYVMDLETRAGRSSAEHASLSVDMLGGRLTMEGPIVERVSYMFAGRGVHGLGTEPFTGGPFPYLYGDALGRLDIHLGKTGRITTTGFWNQESVELDSLSGYQSEAVWGNTAGSIRYRGQIGGSNADITLGIGTFETQLPAGGERPLMTNGVSRRVRVGINLDRPLGSAQLHYGLQFDRLKYEYRVWPRPRTINGNEPILEAEDAGEVAGSYIDLAWQPAQRLQLRTGLRADVFSVDPRPRFAPRASATLLLNDRASLTLAAGRYRQYVRASGRGLTEAGVSTEDSLNQSELRIASASHVVLGLDQELVEGIRIGIEGFYKDFEGLPAADGDRAQASGLDLWVRRGQGRVTGWLGYSLAWIWSSDATRPDRQNFAGRHLLSGGVSSMLGHQGRLDLRVAYGAGLPYTAIPEPETPPVFSAVANPTPPLLSSVGDQVASVPTSPNEPYLRIDLQVARTFITDVRGFAFEVMPYVKVLNALDRRDALFYHFDRSAQTPETRPLAPLPILPVVGFEWRF